MNSLVKVFSNFKEFYSEINGATLTGAIDVIVVEQPDGEFQCSPFHVRFGKLGVLRSREKVVDIEINGEPVDIHMKLGESGEAFFVEECPEEDVEELPENLATSPIPSSYFPNKYNNDTLEEENIVEKAKTASEDILLPLPLPRRNSIDFSKEAEKDENVPKFENQISDFSHRRHTDNTLERRNLNEKLKEYTTQKLRQEWAEHEEIFHFDAIDKDKDWSNSTQADDKQTPALDNQPIVEKISPVEQDNTKAATAPVAIPMSGQLDPLSNNASIKDESKGKKKRRKKSQMKKKNAQRKSSSSSSLGSNTPLEGGNIAGNQITDDGDAISVSISNNTNSSSNDEAGAAKTNDQNSLTLATSVNTPLSETCQTSPITPTTRIPDLDIHFFSDTEVTSSGGNGTCGSGRNIGRPSTPIQSDSELEISLREKDADVELMSNSASWKWGELPTQEQESLTGQAAQAQAQRNSMLSNMFNFMKKNNKIRKQQAAEGGVYLSDLDAEGMDPEMAAMYFPNSALSKEATPSSVVCSQNVAVPDDDRESGNGTSLPHSPSSMEGQKSVDSDYEDGKSVDTKLSGFLALSTCGMSDKEAPSDEEFERHIIKYEDFAIEQFMRSTKQDTATTIGGKGDTVDANTSAGSVAVGQAKRSWWNWRRSQSGVPNGNTNVKTIKIDEKDGDQTAVATQTTRPNSPDISDNTLSKTDSTLNAENTSALVENLEDLSQASLKSESNNKNNKNERYKKSLRLSSEAIKKLNLKDGMNEIEFSVTTAYQGTSRCKCYLFRWKHNDKVVISDIDGTITKSDVLGHILPMVGKDWAQLGVAQLFSKIEQNGYKLLYLSARAIGQSRATREYLRSIRQGDVKLPDGPLLLNPTSLISAFHREVIERKPEEFKIACLSDIRDLFPNKDPFYAGYGNRINDVWAYRAVGIPIMRIFTINTKGELKHELTQTFQSSGYINQSLEVDEHFPPIDTYLYDYKTDTFEDDEEEDELKFSETDEDDILAATDDDNSNDDDNDDEDFVDDDDIVMQEETSLVITKCQERSINASSTFIRIRQNEEQQGLHCK